MPEDLKLLDEPINGADAAPPPIEPPPGFATPAQLNPAMPPIGATLPQGTVPPPEYPPYVGNMPLGYLPPFAGNVPPGAVPPGYPPPQYFMPMEFPPPPAYAVPPPYRGYPWEIVPPAPGNLVQAWFAIATNFSRRTIAARAQAIQPDWTAWSIGVGVVLAALAGVVDGLRLLNFAQPTVTISRAFLTGEGIVIILITPVFLVINVFVVPWFWSLFMTPLLGSPRQRFQRAFRAFALIQPLTSAISLVDALITLAISQFAPVLMGVTSLLLLPLLVYSYMLSIQTGSVGTGLKRWPVFGIQLLAGAAFDFAIAVIGIIAFIIFFALQTH